MFSPKPDRVFAAGIVLLVQSFMATSALATDAALLDEAVLRQSTATVPPEDREPVEKAAKAEQPAEPDEQGNRQRDLSQIVRPTETELRTTTPDLPLGLSIRPTEFRPFDPATNFVFSGNLTTGLGTTAP